MHMNTPDISKVIFSVLAGHGSVSLLSVGSLHTVRVPASFNDDGTIEPPRHVVEYSNDISDELSVVDIITERYDMTPSEASACYNEWLSSASVRMSNGTRIAIEGVGTLSLLAEGAALFSIDERLRALLNPYGGRPDRLTMPGVPGRKKKPAATKATASRGIHRPANDPQDTDRHPGTQHVHAERTPMHERRQSHAPTHEIRPHSHSHTHRPYARHPRPRPHRHTHRVSPGNPRSDRLMILLVVIMTAVCITLISSIYFAPQGTGLHDRISADTITLWLGKAAKWMSDTFDAVVALLRENCG